MSNLLRPFPASVPDTPAHSGDIDYEPAALDDAVQPNRSISAVSSSLHLFHVSSVTDEV
jgi:hypothetical protein